MDNIKNTRIIRGDKPLKSRDTFKAISSGPPCLTITLGDFNLPYVLVDQSGTNMYARVTGGDGSYTPTVDSGSIPTGVTIDILEDDGDYYLTFIDKFTTFGSYTFTIGGTDANGCPITPKEYTIEVWEMKEVTPGTIASDDITLFSVTVNGISGVYGTTATLAKVEFDIVIPDIGNMGLYIDSPDTSPTPSLFSLVWDSQGLPVPYPGADFTGCVINNSNLGSFPSISTSSAPYTGNWNDIRNGLEAYFDDNFTGDTMNGTWNIRIETIGQVGSVTSIKLYFKPL